MTREEQNRLRIELTTRLRALDELAALPEEAHAVSIAVDFGGPILGFPVNNIIRPIIKVLLREEAARLEAIALGVDRKVGP